MKEIVGYKMHDDPISEITKIELRIRNGNEESIYNCAISTHVFNVMSKDWVLDLFLGLAT